MSRRQSTPPAPSRRSPRRILGATVLAVAVVVGAACTANPEVQAGGAGGDQGAADGTAPSAQTAPPTSADRDQVEPSGPTTTCVEGPATTTPNGQGGGGRITCSTIPPDQAVSSPVNTDTTVAVPSTSLSVDNQHGVLVVSAAGGLDCGAEACPDIAMIMQGRIVVDGDQVSESAEIDATGRAGFRLEPGTYQVRAEVTRGSCESTSVTVGLRMHDVALRCTVPR